MDIVTDMPEINTGTTENISEKHRWARLYAAVGERVFPCGINSKEPAVSDWPNAATSDERIIDKWWKQADWNIGIATGEDVGVVDLDIKIIDGVAEWNRLAYDQGTPQGSSLTAQTCSGGRHLYFLNPTGLRNSASKIGPGIDFRGVGGYVVAPPSIVDGKPYSWITGGEDIDLGFLPELADVPDWVIERCQAKRVDPRTRKPDAPTEWDREVDIKEAIKRIDIDLKRNGVPVDGAGSDDQAYRLAARLGDLPLSIETIAELMHEHWAPHFDYDWIESKVANACDPDNGYRQNEAGCDPQQTVAEKYSKFIANMAAETASKTEPDIVYIEGSDDHLALVFEAKHSNHLHFVPEWGKWFDFTGQKWFETDTPAIWDAIRPVARTLAVALGSDAQQRAMTSATKVLGAERLCRGSMRKPATEWDADPWLLNTPGGAVDLRTGVLKLTSPEALCTKMTAVAPEGECPRWLRFLNEITAGDKELQSYLQRLVGYSLIGRVEEHVLAFLYGTGGNGKGVFLGTVAAILGDYAKNAPMDTFTETMGDRHPTDMAMLQGARFVTAQETDAGRAWAEAKIKMLTGGDPITARFMHRNFFTYTPQFTLIIAGNHKPKLHHVDEAIRRRLHMVPFTVKVEEPDIHLAEKLKAEWPGILQWAIDGCLEWQRLGGLLPPQAVVEMTAEYLEAENPVAEWLEDCCERDPNASEPPARLYSSYSEKCMRDGFQRMDQREFSQWLTDQGFRRNKSNSVRLYRGLRLKSQDLSQEIPL